MRKLDYRLHSSMENKYPVCINRTSNQIDCGKKEHTHTLYTTRKCEQCNNIKSLLLHGSMRYIVIDVYMVAFFLEKRYVTYRYT